MANIVWQPYKNKEGGMVHDPIAGTLRGDDPNPGGRWSLNPSTGVWTQQASAPSYSNAGSKGLNSSSSSNSLLEALKGAGSINVNTAANEQFGKLLSQKPEHQRPGYQVYQPKQMGYQDALGQVGNSYQMKGEDQLKGTAQLMADLEMNPLREALERQEQRQDLRYHNTMKQAERLYAGKDQVARDLENRLSKQQAQELASRGASTRSGLAEYHNAKVNEAVAQQLTHLEINKQAAMENLMSEHGLAMEQIDGALLSLEQQRGKLSAANFEKLNSREQEMYLQQENARSQIAMHIMNQFMNGEQLKLQASLSELESADKKYAADIQAWLGQLDMTLESHQSALDASLKGKAMELDYLQTMLPYTQLTAKDEALMDIDWARLMGRTPR